MCRITYDKLILPSKIFVSLDPLALVRGATNPSVILEAAVAAIVDDDDALPRSTDISDRVLEQTTWVTVLLCLPSSMVSTSLQFEPQYEGPTDRPRPMTDRRKASLFVNTLGFTISPTASELSDGDFRFFSRSCNLDTIFPITDDAVVIDGVIIESCFFMSEE